MHKLRAAFQIILCLKSWAWNCAFLVAIATKNWVLVTTILQVMASAILTLPWLTWCSEKYINKINLEHLLSKWVGYFLCCLWITKFHIPSKWVTSFCLATMLFCFQRSRGNFLWQNFLFGDWKLVLSGQFAPVSEVNFWPWKCWLTYIHLIFQNGGE